MSPERQSPIPGLVDKRILVVDDDADACEVLATILELNGAVVTAVQSGAAAVEAFVRSPPDLVILDFGLPDDDGPSLLARLRSIAAARDQQVVAIAVTGYSVEPERDETLAFSARLTKPVVFEKLFAAITAALAAPSSRA